MVATVAAVVPEMATVLVISCERSACMRTSAVVPVADCDANLRYCAAPPPPQQSRIVTPPAAARTTTERQATTHRRVCVCVSLAWDISVFRGVEYRYENARH